MTKLEERIRSGLQETARRIPEGDISGHRTVLRRPTGVWMGVAAAIAVLVLFVPLAFILGSDPEAPPANQPSFDGDVVPAEVGFEFANPEHVRLHFTQAVTLSCDGLETIDNGGFDSFDLDIWIDHGAGFTRLGFEYPDGSTYDLLLKGRPGAWEHAWGSGTDLGRNAGCRENLGKESYEQTVVGWAFHDSSELWFTSYLKPVSPDAGASVLIYHDDRLTPATSAGEKTFLIESNLPDGHQSRFEFTLDEEGIRVIGEKRYIYSPNQFEASATIEVLESGPAAMPVDIFDTSGFTPLWGDNPVVTTAVSP